MYDRILEDVTQVFSDTTIEACYGDLAYVNQVLRFITQLGDFLGHKGELSMKTIWMGLQEIWIEAATLQSLPYEKWVSCV